MLFVYDFGIKNVHRIDVEHLLNGLKDHYKVKIDWTEDFIVASHLTGTTKIDMLTSPCQDTSKSNYKNMNTFERDYLKTAHTQLLQISMEKLPKILSQTTIPKK